MSAGARVGAQSDIPTWCYSGDDKEPDEDRDVKDMVLFEGIWHLKYSPRKSLMRLDV